MNTYLKGYNGPNESPKIKRMELPLFKTPATTTLLKEENPLLVPPGGKTTFVPLLNALLPAI